MTRLRIYFGPLDPARRPVMAAYACGLGQNPEGGYVFQAEGSLDDLRAGASQSFETVGSLQEADLAVYPYNYRNGAETEAFAQQASASGKPCAFFCNLDRPEPAKLPYGFVFQESIFASRRRPCEVAHPAAIEDVLRGGEVTVRDKQERPTVGFRGFPGTSRLHELVRLVVGGREAFLGSYTRRVSIEVCQRSSLLDTRFEIANFTQTDKAQRAELRRAYLRNICESDYVLAIRGAGNWSYRFYEALSAGRIPVFVNTDAQLPLDDSIDWKRHCVWVELGDLRRLPEKIRVYHDALDAEAFRERQQENRRLWVERLEPVAFWRNAFTRLLTSP